MRDFLYIEDVVELYIRMQKSLSTDKKIIGQVFNAGTNRPKTVKEVLKEIFTSTGNLDDYNEILKLMENKTTQGEIDCQFMDYEKVKKNFDWDPQHSFNVGILKTIEWYSKYFKDS